LAPGCCYLVSMRIIPPDQVCRAFSPAPVVLNAEHFPVGGQPRMRSIFPAKDPSCPSACTAFSPCQSLLACETNLVCTQSSLPGRNAAQKMVCCAEDDVCVHRSTPNHPSRRRTPADSDKIVKSVNLFTIDKFKIRDARFETGRRQSLEFSISNLFGN